MDNLENIKVKSNKGLICLVVFLILIIFGLVTYIVYDKTLKKDVQVESKTSTTTTETKTTEAVKIEEVIKKNFLDDIENVKQGKKVNYILCDDEYDCTKIDNIKIDKIEDINQTHNGNKLYRFHFFVECKDTDSCFYNEQFEDCIDDKTCEVGTIYSVNDNGVIVEPYGNVFIPDEE